MNRLAMFLQQKQPQTILDVCTGAGQFIQLLSSLYVDYESIIGIDSLEIAVSTARKNLHKNQRVKVRLMDAHQTTFKDNRFDLVCLSNSFHHIEDKETLLQEMFRVTKPGGFVMISEMINDGLSEAQISHRKIHHFAAEIDQLLGMYHEKTYSSDELLDMLQTLSHSEVSDHWLLDYEHKTTTNDEDVKWFHQTIDRLISRIPSTQEQQPYIKKGHDIKQYITQHGFDSATTMIVVIEK